MLTDISIVVLSAGQTTQADISVNSPGKVKFRFWYFIKKRVFFALCT